MIWRCQAQPCACCRIERPECWCLMTANGTCLRCEAPMGHADRGTDE